MKKIVLVLLAMVSNLITTLISLSAMMLTGVILAHEIKENEVLVDEDWLGNPPIN